MTDQIKQQLMGNTSDMEALSRRRVRGAIPQTIIDEEGKKVKDVVLRVKIRDCYTKKRTEVRISAKDVINNQLYDAGEKTVSLEYEDYPFNTKGLWDYHRDEDFAWVISVILNLAFILGLCTQEQFISMVITQYNNYYMKYQGYFNERRERYEANMDMLDTFYRRYFPRKRRFQVGTVSDMLRLHSDVTEQLCARHYHMKRVAVAFFTRDEIVHPITEKLKLSYIREEDAILICFNLETLNRERLIS